MEHVSDHVDRALSRLLEQYKGKPVISAILTAVARQIQGAEDAAWDVWLRTQMATATGAQLDEVGDIVGQAREGRDDDTYRVWIAARIRLNSSSGTIGEIIDVFMPLLPGATLSIREWFPAAFSLTVSDMVFTPALASQFTELLRAAKAGGVRAFLEWTETPEVATFTLRDAAAPDVTVLGLGTVADPTTGGRLAGAASA